MTERDRRPLTLSAKETLILELLVRGGELWGRAGHGPDQRRAAVVDDLKERGTQGGTHLYVPLERERTKLEDGDFERGSGRVRLVGKLELDYVPVTCVADIDLTTLSGTGHLEPIV